MRALTAADVDAAALALVSGYQRLVDHCESATVQGQTRSDCRSFASTIEVGPLRAAGRLLAAYRDGDADAGRRLVRVAAVAVTAMAEQGGVTSLGSTAENLALLAEDIATDTAATVRRTGAALESAAGGFGFGLAVVAALGLALYLRR